jgi:hypothetical protein
MHVSGQYRLGKNFTEPSHLTTEQYSKLFFTKTRRQRDSKLEVKTSSRHCGRLMRAPVLLHLS